MNKDADVTALIAGTSEGLFRISSGKAVRLADFAGVLGVAVAGSRIAAVLASGAICLSEDRGQSWNCCEQFPLQPVSVVFDAHDPDHLYAGTKPAGILESRDGGRNWSLLKDFRDLPGTEFWDIPQLDTSKPRISEAVGEGAAAWTVRPDPRRKGRIIVGVEVGGLVITDDGGKTWRVTPVDDTPDPHDVVIHPADSDIVVVSTGYSRFTEKPGVFEYSPTGGVYRSGDAASTFRSVWPNPDDPQYTRLMSCDAVEPYAITVCCRSSYVQPNNPNGERRADLRQSRDAGRTWVSLGGKDHSCFSEEYSAVVADPMMPGNVWVGTEKGRLFYVNAANLAWVELEPLPGRINSLQAIQLATARREPLELANTTL